MDKKLYSNKWGKTRDFYSLLPNVLAMIGRTSSASARISKKGSNDINEQSDGSSNQLSIGIPLFTCSLKTWNQEHVQSLSTHVSNWYRWQFLLLLFIMVSPYHLIRRYKIFYYVTLSECGWLIKLNFNCPRQIGKDMIIKKIKDWQTV